MCWTFGEVPDWGSKYGPEGVYWVCGKVPDWWYDLSSWAKHGYPHSEQCNRGSEECQADTAGHLSPTPAQNRDS